MSATGSISDSVLRADVTTWRSSSDSVRYDPCSSRRSDAVHTRRATARVAEANAPSRRRGWQPARRCRRPEKPRARTVRPAPTGSGPRTPPPGLPARRVSVPRRAESAAACSESPATRLRSVYAPQTPATIGVRCRARQEFARAPQIRFSAPFRSVSRSKAALTERATPAFKRDRMLCDQLPAGRAQAQAARLRVQPAGGGLSRDMV